MLKKSRAKTVPARLDSAIRTIRKNTVATLFYLIDPHFLINGGLLCSQNEQENMKSRLNSESSLELELVSGHGFD